jgi:hypothetical protein
MFTATLFQKGHIGQMTKQGWQKSGIFTKIDL